VQGGEAEHCIQQLFIELCEQAGRRCTVSFFLLLPFFPVLSLDPRSHPRRSYQGHLLLPLQRSLSLPPPSHVCVPIAPFARMTHRVKITPSALELRIALTVVG